MIKSLARGAALCALLLAAGPASAADLEEIKARGHMEAATSGNLPPVSFVNEKNELTGFDIQVAKGVEKRLGVEIRLNRLDFKGILPGLQTGRFDAVFSNVNITPERKDTFDYSIPYSRSAVVVVRRAGADDITGPDTLAGKQVGAISGANDGEVPARALEKEHGAFGAFRGYAGYSEMFADLGIGRVEAIVAPDTAAANFIRQRPGVAEIVGEPVQVRFVGVPMQKGSAALKAEIDKAIREMRDGGEIDAWAKEFFGIENFSAQLVDEVP